MHHDFDDGLYYEYITGLGISHPDNNDSRFFQLGYWAGGDNCEEQSASTPGCMAYSYYSWGGFSI